MFFNPDSVAKYSEYVVPQVVKCEQYLDIRYYMSNKWLIIDGDGFRYYFGGSVSSKESSCEMTVMDEDMHASSQGVANRELSFSQINYDKEPTTCWMLDSIVAPNGDKLEFMYKEYAIATPTFSHELIRLRRYGDEYPTPSVYMQLDAESQYNEFSYTQAIIKHSILSKIVMPNGTIDFYVSERKDTQGAYSEEYINSMKLDKISIASNLDKKSFLLKYDYLGDSLSYNKCRLMLNSVIEKGKSDCSSPKYDFTYNRLRLPAKNSRQRDYWDYYNASKAPYAWNYNAPGFYEEGTLFPTMVAPYHVNRSQYRFGRNRKADCESMEHGMLQSIRYPTGGTTYLKYGINTFKTHDIDVYSYENISYIGEASINQSVDGRQFLTKYSSSSSVPFKIESVGDIKINFRKQTVFQVKLPSGPVNFAVFTIKNVNSGQVVYNNTITMGDGFNTITSFEIKNLPIGSYLASFSCIDNQYIPYEIKYNDIKGPVPNMLSAMVSLEFVEKKSEINRISNGGGLRVESLCDVDIDGDTTSYRKFNYVLEDGTTSGEIYTVPQFQKYYRHECKGKLAGGENDFRSYDDPNNKITSGEYEFPYVVGYYFITSDPLIPLTPTFLQGPVAYDRVEEIFKSKESSYTTVWNFNRYNSVSSGDWPGARNIGNPSSGTISKKTQYDSNGNIQKKEEYTYINKNRNSTRAWTKLMLFKPLEYYHGLLSLSQTTDNNVFDDYYLRSYSYKLKTMQLTEYFNLSKDSIITINQYEYDPINYKVTSISTTLSNGDSLLETRTYPTLCKDAMSASMRGNNMVNALRESSYYKNGKLLGQKFIDYKTINNNIIVPASIKEYRENFLVDNINYTDYDKYGNLLCQTKNACDSTIYIWSYNHQYLIAEIYGSTMNEVKAAIGGNTNLLLLSKDPMSYDISSLRQKLPNARITTYTYKPIIGMTSSTNNRGITTYYEYDSLWRLKEVYQIENGVKKILEAYCYNFSVQ